MQALPKLLTAALALLALAGAQVFGLQRGYVCLCNDEPVETTASHCDPSGECCGHEHGSEEGGTSQEHAPLTVKLDVQGNTGASHVLQAPALIAVVDLPTLPENTASQVLTQRTSLRPPPDPDCNPPASLLVAECTVLLV